ncbi:uncharacterized protein LOC124930264 [Impatiens glandulifera]|uniref:uncharacterized protein LOC124930264 n=1 Tax=Impatiens glandulifera TaxID=253017 RepID=UPI001FB09C91|nr:uncharacterized protein LOC124930264 [Impatiens glandulifera]
MDMEQEEMQFLGLIGIYVQSYKIIITWRKLFSRITLALILPLSIIFLAQMEINDILFYRIDRNEERLEHTPYNSPKYDKLSDLISSEWAFFFLFRLLYWTFVLVFSLLSTSAVVYTVASVYTGKHVSFREIISVVPKVWKRLAVTFLCAFAFFFLYNIVFTLLFVLWAFTLSGSDGVGPVTIIVLFVAYFIGFIYMSIIWQMASVVSVMEDSFGLGAMRKSKDLIKGKMWIAIVIFVKLNVSLAAIQILFQLLVAYGGGSAALKIGMGVLCLLLLLKLILMGLVIQTVFYFVCKSYHHQSIDKSALSDHLDVYLGEYEPLKEKDVQLQHFQV